MARVHTFQITQTTLDELSDSTHPIIWEIANVIRGGGSVQLDASEQLREQASLMRHYVKENAKRVEARIVAEMQAAECTQ